MRPLMRVIAALWLLLLAPFAHAQETPAAPPAALSIADFMADPLIEDVALAPGGGFVAYVQREKDTSFLVVRDLNDMDAKPVVRRLGEVRVYGLKWVNDERLIYSAGANETGFDFSGGQLVYTGVPRLFASSRDLNDLLVFFQGEKRTEAANAITTSDISSPMTANTSSCRCASAVISTLSASMSATANGARLHPAPTARLPGMSTSTASR